MSPYNDSPNTVLQWKESLDQLVKYNGQELRIDVDTSVISPHMVAYYLREAIRAARIHDIHPYAKLRYSFSAHNREGYVIAKPKDKRYNVRVSVFASTENTHPQVITAFDVVEMVQNNPAEVMTFPSFNDEIESVRAWAGPHGYEIAAEKPLTLKKV